MISSDFCNLYYNFSTSVIVHGRSRRKTVNWYGMLWIYYPMCLIPLTIKIFSNFDYKHIYNNLWTQSYSVIFYAPNIVFGGRGKHPWIESCVIRFFRFTVVSLKQSSVVCRGALSRSCVGPNLVTVSGRFTDMQN